KHDVSQIVQTTTNGGIKYTTCLHRSTIWQPSSDFEIPTKLCLHVMALQVPEIDRSTPLVALKIPVKCQPPRRKLMGPFRFRKLGPYPNGKWYVEAVVSICGVSLTA